MELLTVSPLDVELSVAMASTVHVCMDNNNLLLLISRGKYVCIDVMIRNNS